MMREISSATVGRSSITPVTWPLDSTPASSLPSTSPARSSIGVLAASASCDHFRFCSLRIARPSRTMPRHDVPDIFLNAAALRNARGMAMTAFVCSSSSTNSVRSTRWGTPSMRVVTTVSVTLRSR